eukprot:scaffold6829_cov171-Amphora_coffeaeformis.AAC.12
MQQMEGDDTPAEEWTQQLNAVCNRLSTQYLSLLRTASSVSALGDESRHDPRCEWVVLCNVIHIASTRSGYLSGFFLQSFYRFHDYSFW